MKFPVDECLPEALVHRLSAMGHDVVWARECYTGWDDESLTATAIGDGRIIISQDRDFGHLVFKLLLRPPGIVLLYLERFAGPWQETINQCAMRISELGSDLSGYMTIIEPGRIRQRKLEQD